jgi:hypothetical protein
MGNTLTPTQQFKLKELNNKLYTGITGTNRDELIENFDAFLQQYEKHVQFMEELNFFKNSIKQRYYTKQMELSVGTTPKNQLQAIKGWLQQGKTINWLQAAEYFGCARLAPVIHVLRHKHQMNIKDVGTHRWSDYKLIEE